MPSICPRDSRRQVSPSGRPKTQNLRLDDPAFSTEGVIGHGCLPVFSFQFPDCWLTAESCGLTAERRACARSFATAQLAILERTLSARLVRMIGTRAPSTRPALSALARKLSCLASMLPASRSGTRRMSGSPATFDVMPFTRAASRLMALSNASGPSSRPPVIWPRSAILQSAAASMVAASWS